MLKGLERTVLGWKVLISKYNIGIFISLCQEMSWSYLHVLGHFFMPELCSSIFKRYTIITLNKVNK